jgi:signal transduction histidine kinase
MSVGQGIEQQPLDSDEIAAVAAHELRNPLTAMAGVLCLWRDDASLQTPANVRELLDRQLRKALRLLETRAPQCRAAYRTVPRGSLQLLSERRGRRLAC